MLFTDIDILDENFDYQAHQWVGVKDGKIDYIGDAAPENAACSCRRSTTRTRTCR